MWLISDHRAEPLQVMSFQQHFSTIIKMNIVSDPLLTTMNNRNKLFRFRTSLNQNQHVYTYHVPCRVHRMEHQFRNSPTFCTDLKHCSFTTNAPRTFCNAALWCSPSKYLGRHRNYSIPSSKFCSFITAFLSTLIFLNIDFN